MIPMRPLRRKIMDGFGGCGNVDAALNGNALSILNCVWHGRNIQRPPSLRQIQRACGLPSLNGLMYYLMSLRRLGLLTWQSHGEGKGSNRTLVPLCRFVPADELGVP